jgi:hypothetical protein
VEHATSTPVRAPRTRVGARDFAVEHGHEQRETLLDRLHRHAFPMR